MVLLVLQDCNYQTLVKSLIDILFLLLVPKLEFHMPLLCFFCHLFFILFEKPFSLLQGWSQTFLFGGTTGGASFATRGAVNGLCRTFRKRPEKFWEAVAPLAPPSSVPGLLGKTIDLSPK